MYTIQYWRLITKEYRMIYREPGFLPPPPPPSPVSKLSLFLSSCVSPIEPTEGEGGGGANHTRVRKPGPL
jgi:hypothetical protein